MKLLSYKLWKEKRESAPSRSYKLSLQKKLNQAWLEKNQTAKFWYQLSIFRYSMVALLVVVVLASTGTGAYAYGSPSVNEGTLLYPVKQAIEKIEEKTKKNPEAKAKFYLKQIQRREAEKQILDKKQKREVQLQQLENKINKTEEQLEKVNNDLATSSLKEQVKQRLEKRQVKLEEKKNKDTEKLLERQEKIKKQE